MGVHVDWSNERYVRLYTRDSVTWAIWPWESQALFCLLLRKVDRAGVLEMGPHDPKDAISAIIRMPPDVVDIALRPILNSGAAEIRGDVLVMPNFISAQEARSSDKQRQRDSREKRRAKAMSHGNHQNVTDSDSESHRVTTGHGESQGVTPSLAELNQAELNQKNIAPDGSQNLELIPAEHAPDLESFAALSALWLDGERIRSAITSSKRPRGFAPKDKKRLRELIKHIRAREGCTIAEAHDKVRKHWSLVVAGHDGDLRRSNNFWLSPNSYDYNATEAPKGKRDSPDSAHGFLKYEHLEGDDARIITDF